jgi:hypothetical protein
MRFLRLALAVVFVVPVAACSADRAAQKSPEATPAAAPALAEPPPPADRVKSEGAPSSKRSVSSSDAAADLATIALAESQILALAIDKSAEKKAPAEPGKAAASRSSAAPQPDSASSCPSACSALGSMTRATDHLCSLTGEGDVRCADARTRTKSATTRVQGACSC